MILVHVLTDMRAANAQATGSLEHSMLAFMKVSSTCRSWSKKNRYIPLGFCEYKLIQVEVLYSYTISTKFLQLAKMIGPCIAWIVTLKVFNRRKTGSEVIKSFSCSTQLSMNF